MAKTLTQSSEPVDENVELKVAVRLQIANLEAANRRMAERNARIEKLKAETRAILHELKVVA